MHAPHITVPHPGPRTREVLDRLGRVELGAGLTRGLADHPPVMARAEGAVIEDPDGNRFLDMVAGFGSLNLGHSHPRIVAAVADQVALGQQAMSIASTVRTELSERLSSLVPSAPRVVLGASGSEAAETALKLVRRLTGRHGVIAFAGGFHGRTMGALALMGRAGQRAGLGPLGHVVHLPFPDPLRSPFGDDAGTVRDVTLELIDQQLRDPAGGWDGIGAVVIEPVQGNGGMTPVPPGFLTGLREVCDRHDLVLVIDEVMSGFHRTGRTFAFEHERGVDPEVVVMGKSLSAGLPLSGCLVSERVAAGTPPGTESSTYAGNLVSCAAALAALEVYDGEEMSATASRSGKVLADMLHAALGDHPAVSEIRGLGLMVAVELTEDGDPHRPLAVARRISEACVGRGLLVYPGGHHGNVVAMLPPLICTDEQYRSAVSVLAEVVAATL